MKNLKIKKLINLIVVCVCTLAITLLAIAIFCRLITPKSLTFESFYDEPKNTVDVLFLGSSHCLSAVSPIDIYDKTAIKSYNISTSCQPIWVSYHYLKEALKYQKPKVVFVEVFGAFYGKSYASIEQTDKVDNQFSQQIKPSLNLLELNLIRRKASVTPQPWYNRFNTSRYHSRLFELEPSDFDAVFKDNYSTTKGFTPALGHQDFNNFVQVSTDRREPLYEYCEEYLIKSIELAKKEGIELVFFKTPFITKETDVAVINTIQDLADKYNVPFLDFCTDNPLDIDFAREMVDQGHINYFGAKKLNEFLCDYMQTNYSSILNTTPNTLWNEAAAIQLTDFENVVFRMSQNFKELAASAKSSENVSIIIAKQGNLSVQNELALAQKLSIANIDGLEESILENDLVIIEANKILTQDEALTKLKSLNITLKSQDGKVQIIQNGQNYSRTRDGINIALYNKQSNSIFHNFTMAIEHDFEFFTD